MQHIKKHLTLIDKLLLLAKIEWPDLPKVKEIALNDYAKDLFKGSDVYQAQSAKYQDIRGYYKVATDLSGDKVYYFYNWCHDKAFRLTRSALPVNDPASYIFDYILKNDLYKEQ